MRKLLIILAALVLFGACCEDDGSTSSTTSTTTIEATTTTTSVLTTTSSSTTTASSTSTTTVPETTTTTEMEFNNFLWMGEPAPLGLLLDNPPDYSVTPNSEESVLAAGEFVEAWETVIKPGEVEYAIRVFRFDFGINLDTGERIVIDLTGGALDNHFTQFKFVDCWVPLDPTAPPEAGWFETMMLNFITQEEAVRRMVPGVRYPVLVQDLALAYNGVHEGPSWVAFTEAVERQKSVIATIRHEMDWGSEPAPFAPDYPYLSEIILAPLCAPSE